MRLLIIFQHDIKASSHFCLGYISYYLCTAEQKQTICITFIQHCINVIQMFCAYWVFIIGILNDVLAESIPTRYGTVGCCLNPKSYCEELAARGPAIN